MVAAVLGMVHGVGFDKADDIGALTGLDYPDAAAGSRVFALRQGGAIDKDFRAAGEIGNVRREVLLSAGEHFRAILEYYDPVVHVYGS